MMSNFTQEVDHQYDSVTGSLHRLGISWLTLYTVQIVFLVVLLLLSASRRRFVQWFVSLVLTTTVLPATTMLLIVDIIRDNTQQARTTFAVCLAVLLASILFLLIRGILLFVKTHSHKSWLLGVNGIIQVPIEGGGFKSLMGVPVGNGLTCTVYRGSCQFPLDTGVGNFQCKSLVNLPKQLLVATPTAVHLWDNQGVSSITGSELSSSSDVGFAFYTRQPKSLDSSSLKSWKAKHSGLNSDDLRVHVD